jgi:hypothetical protein
MIIDTSRWRADHDAAPRGFGLWIFESLTSRNRFEFTGTYADATTALRRHAQELATGSGRSSGDAWQLCP